jgi:pyrroline-5-carboxylate reductase
MKATVFLGGGRITGALARGLRLAGYTRPIVVYDRNPEKLRVLRRESQVEAASDLRSAVARAEMLIIAVRPASVAGLLSEIAACGARHGLCVSLAAGIPLRILRSHLGRSSFGRPARWVRAMPSPVSRIGRGLTALCFDRGIAKTERLRVRELFQCVGQAVEVREAQFDAFTAAFSPTHGYHALAMLSQAARGVGLDRKVALAAAAHALADGISYWRESRVGLGELLHEAATPRGIAAATIAAMEASGYKRAVSRGLKAGIARARKNARIR